jgi:MFS family permease
LGRHAGVDSLSGPTADLVDRAAGLGRPVLSGVRTDRRSRLAFPLLAYVFSALMVGTTLPTPMYALYGERMHFSILTTTVIFAMYVGGVLAALLVFGRWSDAVGRRPMLLLAIVFALSSASVFLAATGVDDLLLGRVLSGLSAGVATGTATAAVIEAAPDSRRGRAAAIATVANIGGLGSGPLLAGWLVQYAPAPLKLPFVVHIALMVLAAACVAIAPETSPRHERIGFQRLALPPQVRRVFIIAATAGFAGFAVLGHFGAVSPSFLSNVVGIDNHALAGAIVFSIFASSALAQLASGRIEANRAVAVGCGVLMIGTLIVAASLQFSSLALLVLGAFVAGAGQGISFSRGLSAVADLTPADRRAEVSSAYFFVVYIGLSLPVIGEGLAAQAWGLRTAGTVFALAVSALAAVCLAAVLVEERRG